MKAWHAQPKAVLLGHDQLDGEAWTRCFVAEMEKLAKPLLKHQATALNATESRLKLRIEHSTAHE